jgi:hypothetical protein
MISKKLFNIVIGEDVKNIYELGSNPNLSDFELPYSVHGTGDLLSINIYELAHRCKEWAMNRNTTMDKMYDLVVSTYNRIDFKVEIVNSPGDWKIVKTIYYGQTEPEAIFKACQWILDNKDSK